MATDTATASKAAPASALPAELDRTQVRKRAALLERRASFRAGPELRVCVVGLGYIGLPTASLLGTKGCQVTGVDVSFAMLERGRDWMAQQGAGFDPVHGDGFQLPFRIDATISSAASPGSMSAGILKSFCSVMGVFTKPGFTTQTPMPFGRRSR